MVRLSPGWLVAFCAAILAVAVWLPWLTTRAAGGGRANAVGGVVGNLSLALAISVLIAVLTMWYYRLYVHPPVSAGYGFYIGAAVTGIAIVLSVWAMVAAWAAVGRRP